MRKCFFEKSYFSLDAKRQVYKVCVVSVLLYGSETWVLTEELFRKLEVFHNHCVRVICGVSRWRQWHHRIHTWELNEKLEISPMREMIYTRQLRWLGHVRRMPEDRLPRRLLTSWVYNPRTQGGQEMNYGRAVSKALYWAGIDTDDWFDLAAVRSWWARTTNGQI